MPPLPKEPPIWTVYLPGPPSLWEIVVLVFLVSVLLYGGVWAKRRWTRENDSVPFPVALILWIVMVTIYLSVAASFYIYAPPEQKATILAWFFVFWILPAAYYGYTVVNSLAMRTVDHIGPFSSRIDDPSEFAAARKLALRGEIDAAVAAYRGYTDNQAAALFEAARLLKSEDRFLEAARLLEEIAERFQGKRRIWAEATYQLAKLREVNMGELKAAMALLRNVMQRASETRFGQLAANDLARLQVLDASFLDELAGEEDVAPVDPFFGKGKARFVVSPEDELPSSTPDENEAPVPEQDPFYVRREQEAKAAEAAAEGLDAEPPAMKKSGSKKKASKSNKSPE